MIGDKVSAIAMRHYEPYSVRRSCERCHAIDYVARLLQPFRPALHVCRSCRQALTGVPDTRNMRTPIPGAARVAVEFAELAPPPVVIRGLLMPGPHVHACAMDDDDEVSHSICVCSCGATATNTMGEAEWWERSTSALPPMPAIDPSRTPKLSEEEFSFVFGDHTDDEEDDGLPTLSEIEREIQQLDALDRELDAMIAELDQKGRVSKHR